MSTALHGNTGTGALTRNSHPTMSAILQFYRKLSEATVVRHQYSLIDLSVTNVRRAKRGYICLGNLGCP